MFPGVKRGLASQICHPGPYSQGMTVVRSNATTDTMAAVNWLIQTQVAAAQAKCPKSTLAARDEGWALCGSQRAR